MPPLMQIVKVAVEYIGFDPNYDVSDEDEDMGEDEEEEEEEEDEGEEMTEDDDDSWRVRRACCR